MLSSRYLHVTPSNIDGRAIVFSTLTGSLIEVDERLAQLIMLSPADMPPPAQQQLLQAKFIFESEEAETEFHAQLRSRAKERASRFYKLTVETGLDCNLSCVYCYENSYRQARPRLRDMDDITRNIFAVLNSNAAQADLINLSFIGGEPLMELLGVSEVIRAVKNWASKDYRKTRVVTAVDTNGLMLTHEAIELFDTISVSLTPGPDHDVMRPLLGGGGSYKRITKRLASLAPSINATGTRLSIRYNLHAGNEQNFDEWLSTLDDLGLQRYEIEVAPILNWGGNAIVTPAMRRSRLNLQLKAYRHCIERNIPLNVFPLPAHVSCAAYEGRSVKLLTDGTAALCNADMDAAPLVKEGGALIPQHSRSKIPPPNPLPETRCADCKYLPLCGGQYFCKDPSIEPTLSQCQFLPYDLDDFLRFFCETYAEHPELFLVTPGAGLS